MRFVVFCLILLGASATWRGCGDECDNSNQCNDALCSKCSANFPQKGVCVSGATCNATCILDSDCERLRYCYQCTQGRCSPGPLYPVQCKDCNADTDCNPSSNCRKCLADTSVKAGKRCAGGCGGKCANNYDCGYGTQCSRCDPSTNTCQKGSGCGSTCGVDADCDQGGLCHLCIDFTCSVPCNSKCSNMEDCNGPITGCGVCQNGDCVPGIICGSRCLYDRDCANAGQCTSCTNGKCAAASACGATCTNSTQCGNSQCPACIGGKCTTAQCGSACSSASDCSLAGNCTSCTLGQCTQPACGSDCNSNGDCALASGGCTTCRGGQCSAPTCGSPCSGTADCAHAGPCIDCKDGACTYRPPPNCEDHAPCTPGNNNQCPNTTCSRCDPFTATCRIGGPCGAACIVQTDCNQMLAECKYCRDICTGLPEFLQAAKSEFGDLPVEDLQALEDAKRLKAKMRLN